MTYLTQLLGPIIPPRFSKKRVAISIPSHVHIWKYLWPFRHKALCFSFAGRKLKSMIFQQPDNQSLCLPPKNTPLRTIMKKITHILSQLSFRKEWTWCIAPRRQLLFRLMLPEEEKSLAIYLLFAPIHACKDYGHEWQSWYLTRPLKPTAV